jgi:flavin-dependent dehydrogenase
MSRSYDVVIAGGGPSGSSTGNFLRQKGHRVLVLEREQFPRFHVGESLLPYSNHLWEELGVLDQMNARFQHKPGARFIHEESGAHFTYYFDTAIRPGPNHAFHVKRADFDHMLLERAREVGVEVREQTTVDAVDFRPNGVVVSATGPDGAAYTVEAPMFIDATGRDAFIASKRRIKVADDLITTNVSLNCMYAGVAREGGLEEGHVLIGLFDGGWYWVIPFSDGDASVGFVLEKRFSKVRRGQKPAEMYEQILAGLPYLRNLMRDATPRLEVFTEGNWSYSAQRFYDDRLLLVGDSAAFVDPLFSTGVLLAVNAAKLASTLVDEALRDGDFSAARFSVFQERCQAETKIFKTLITEFYAENLRRLLIASSVNPTVCSVIVSVLAGDVAQPAMWHGLVGKPGFSNVPEADFKGLEGSFLSSREVLAASKLGRTKPG